MSRGCDDSPSVPDVPPPLEDRLESLERAVHEIEALEAIYGHGDGEVAEDVEGNDEASSLRGAAAAASASVSHPFAVLTPSELRAARSAARSSDGLCLPPVWTAPRLEVAIRISLDDDDDADAAPNGSSVAAATLNVTFPPGYPSHAAAMPFVASADGIGRARRDLLTERLVQSARESVGTECVMDLVQELTETLSEWRVQGRNGIDGGEDDDGCCCCGPAPGVGKRRFGRRWIWCHHITNPGRLKSIVREARSLSLGGYLHGGYPGVVAVEGTAESCDEFVSWIKGNKSRPGGFGRNWGHHVRGEIEWACDKDGEREEWKLPEEFTEVDDLKALGATCRARGLEGEFLEYVMQHRGGGED